MARPAKPKTAVPVPAEEKEPTIRSAPSAPSGHLRVRTTGGFMLTDIITGAEIGHVGVHTVPDSPFIRDRIELGQLEIAD